MHCFQWQKEKRKQCSFSIQLYLSSGDWNWSKSPDVLGGPPVLDPKASFMTPIMDSCIQHGVPERPLCSSHRN